MRNYDSLKVISLILVIIGAINWAFVGVFNLNLVGFLFGEKSPLSRMIYTLVGAAGVYLGLSFKKAIFSS